MSQPFRGVFTIPATPFDERGEIDEGDLRRIIDFCVGCGAHGIVYPVNASHFSTLSDEERVRASRIVTEQTAGRIPVMIGVAGVSQGACRHVRPRGRLHGSRLGDRHDALYQQDQQP